MRAKVSADPTDRIDGMAPAIQALREQIRHLAAFDAVGGAIVPTLLLQGETGTGKGLVARIVHDAGPRSRGPFIPVNCAAIPETMLEAELFGYEPGAFTDAKRAKPGLFEAAAGGTLFLDEIDSLSLALQSKLLTAIEDKRVRRLGALTEQAVDVKLLAATQHELGRLAATGRFRPDLYHRLAVVVLALPPLRERGDDVVLLSRALLGRFAAGYAVAQKQLTPDAEAWLRRYPWPGNVRELGHAMERVTLLHDGARVDAGMLEQLVRPAGATVPQAAAEPRPTAAAGAESVDVESEEARRLRDALARTGGNVLATARLLGVTRDTVRYRMRRHGISRPDLNTPLSPAGVPTPSAPTRDAAVIPERSETPAVAAARGAAPSDAGLSAGEPEPSTAPHAWEQKPVALVAIELTWPAAAGAQPLGHEPWTEAARWQQAIREKLEGLGGTLLPHNPSLMVWAFGIPRALDQLHERAMHGALAVRNLAAGLTPRERAPELRLAVHAGALLVDGGSDDPARAALPVGESLALPVRLLAHAERGEILASSEVERRVASWLKLEPVELHRRPDGTPLAAYRVIGIVPPRDRGAIRRPRSLTRFVGRERELETLHELASTAVAGSGLAVGLVGEAGAGKSRLLHELGRRLREDGVRYGEAHCHAAGSVTPYMALREILAIQVGVAEVDRPEVVTEKLLARLSTLDLDPERHAPYLLWLLGAADLPGQVGDDGEAVKRRTFDAIHEVFLAEAHHEPFVMAVENAHWIDPTSEEWLAILADRLPSAPLLLTMSYRPGYRPPWIDRAHATQIALRPLGPEASRQLVRAAVGAASVPQGVEEEILAKAGGNPLFLEELARTVVEHSGAAELTIPDTVHAVLSARIDRLSRDDKHILQTAAVIGRSVPLAVLTVVSGKTIEVLEERMARLVAGDFLFDAGAGARRSYVFKHVLTRLAAYESLPLATRQHVHRQVLDALEGSGSEPRPEQLEELARHATAAASWEKAVGYASEAASQARSRHAHREAARCFELASAALSHLPEEPGTVARACDLHFDHAQALYSLGDLERARGELREALVVAEKLEDYPRLARILMGLLHVHSTAGRYEEAVAAGERVLVIAESIRSAAVKIWAHIGLCRVGFAAGDYRRGAESARAAIEGLHDEPETGPVGLHWVLHPAAAARTYLALCLARTGDFEEAVRHGAEGMRLAARSGAPLDRVWAAYGLARVYHARTDFARAIPLLEQALTLVEGQSGPIFLARVLAGLASAYAQSGRVAEAPPLLERALAVGGSIHLEQGRALIVVQLGETRLAEGALDVASRLADEALSLSRDRREQGNEAWALHLAGEVAARRAPAGREEALGRYGEALALADALGMRPLAARCRLSLGALALASGRRDEARIALAAAVAELSAMEMGRWCEHAQALLAQCTGSA